MPKCTQCNCEVKENATYCPACGSRNPLDKKNQRDDFTLAINSQELRDVHYAPKEKKVAAMLAIMVGFAGLQYRYLENKKMSLIINILSLIVCLLVSFLTYIFITKDISICIALGIIGVYIMNAIDGLTMLILNRKDGHGEVLR